MTKFNDQSGGSELHRLVREHDWAATPLGPNDKWPQSLRTVVDLLLTSRFSMWMGWGPELTFLYNDAYRRDTLGEKHPWALGRRADEVWAEIWEDLEPRVRAVIEGGVATWDEALLLFLERSGYREETYHTFSYSPLHDESGKIAGLFCVVMEETERVIGQRRLATLRNLANALASTTSEQEVFDAVQHVLGANEKDLPFTLTYLFAPSASAGDAPAAARLASASGIERTHPAAVHEIDVRARDNAWPVRELIANGDPVIADDLASRFDGALPAGAWDRAPERAVLVPIARPGQEQPTGFFIAALNPYRQLDAAYAGFVNLIAGQIGASLANARAYEEERMRADALLELDRAKTEFFSNVSHEFRTPLTLLLGPAEDALADPTTAPENRDRIEIIHRNALRLLKLVNTLLDFSRIEAGRVQATYRPTDLSALTIDLASSFRAAIERAGLQLVIDAPPLAEPVYVDREMWEKVVLNLLSNAFKHTFEGEIDVTVRAEDDVATVSVHDTGVGIPAAELPHLFERFHRVPNGRSRTHEGTGIGLALVQELVRLHHGEITVESEQGKGTIFTVRIPLGTEHLPAERIQNTAAESGAQDAPLSTSYTEEARRWLGEDDDIIGDLAPPRAASTGGVAPVDAARILLADDNADMRDYAARLLRARGWTVETAPDGAAALERARQSPPDLVLSDVMMPVLDGFGLLRALRGDPALRAIPVILLSARAGEEARVEGLDAGADDYLVKPFAARELVARVGAHLALARERERARTETSAAATRLRRVFTQAPVAIAVLRGPEHRFEIANEPYLRLVGGRNIVGLPIREALPELAGQGIFELLDRVYQTKTPHVGSELPVRIHGEPAGELREAFFNFVYQPLLDATGDAEAIAVVVTDVTDLVRSRQEAQEAQREAERANRAKSEFLAAMSHELRTPLNAIAGYAELMDMGLRGPMTEAQRLDIGRIRRSQQHLLSLINDVLNFAKLEAGRFEYDMQPVKLAPIVADLVTMIQPQLVAKGLVYRAAVAPDIAVLVDPDKLQQILLNLLSNAIKFTEKGGRITVDVATRATGDDGGKPGVVFLRVSDTGIGIPRDKQDAVFDPFIQAHRQLTSTTEGTGLGLSISRDLARGMGGDLRVRSVEGEGSVFTLSLQMVQDERATDD